MKSISMISVLSLLASSSAFTPVVPKHSSHMTVLPSSFDPLNLPQERKMDHLSKVSSFAAAAAIVISPVAAFAEEASDYEYGAVDAPIGLAWGAGVLAILTALLPIALRGGEDAFNEMKEKDADTWGTGNTNKLDKKKK